MNLLGVAGKGTTFTAATSCSSEGFELRPRRRPPPAHLEGTKGSASRGLEVHPETRNAPKYRRLVNASYCVVTGYEQVRAVFGLMLPHRSPTLAPAGDAAAAPRGFPTLRCGCECIPPSRSRS